MKAAIISLGSKSSKWTAEAMRKYFDEVEEINLKNIEISFTGKKQQILYENKPLKKYDCIYAKGSFRYGNLLSAITSMLEKTSYLPIDSSAFTIAHDKLLTQLQLNAANIPMPQTYLTSTIDEAKKILKKMNYPIIMKFPKGTQGKGVMFADSCASATSVLDALSVLKQPVIIQEYVETGGTDVRAVVVGNKVVAAYRRVAQIGETRSNIHQGGSGEAVNLNDHTKKIAIKAAKALKADICGVDILESVKGPVVIEVNISPGLQGVTQYTGVDVADKIAKFLFETSKSIKNVETKSKAKTLFTDLGIDDSTVISAPQLITNIELRGNRILLPELVTKKTKFSDDEEICMILKEGLMKITKL
jgi:ribosomal protein S6--L-glutamate ligase